MDVLPTEYGSCFDHFLVLIFSSNDDEFHPSSLRPLDMDDKHKKPLVDLTKQKLFNVIQSMNATHSELSVAANTDCPPVNTAPHSAELSELAIDRLKELIAEHAERSSSKVMTDALPMYASDRNTAATKVDDASGSDSAPLSNIVAAKAG